VATDLLATFSATAVVRAAPAYSPIGQYLTSRPGIGKSFGLPVERLAA
jgi:hypothetical protein